jgi:hypothetical protein
MKYMMLIMDTEAARSMSEAESQAWYPEIMAWYDKAGGTGKLADSGAQLQPAGTARTIRAGKVTDGPFMEAKEVLGGYSVLETDTMAEAEEIASSWPGIDRGWITIELRPLLQM